MLHRPRAQKREPLFIPTVAFGENKQEETGGGKKCISPGKKMRVAPDDVDFDTC